MTLKRSLRRAGLTSVAAMVGVSGLVVALGNSSSPLPKVQTVAATTKTPIQHLVVIFQENESFDHYFGTYPVASNPAGENLFTALPGTPSVNGLVANSLNGNVNLLSSNPNGVSPQRLDPGANANGVYNGSLDANGSNSGIDQVLTCSQNHNYQPEQQASDGGAMDLFPSSVGVTSAAPEPGEPACTTSQNLDYYDGNTVTGYWNYAQHFAMSDNNFGTTYGPSTPGAINVISGDTGNFNLSNNAATTPGALTATNSALVPDGDGAFSDINDADPYFDDCSSVSSNIGVNDYNGSAITDPNVGDLLSEQGISWGWFQGGFAPTTLATGATDASYTGGPNAQAGKATCTAVHNTGTALGGGDSASAQPYGSRGDYSAHHEPFQYYASTANPRHYAPTSLSAIGTDTQSWTGGSYGVGTPKFNTANHQYDIGNFNDLVSAIRQGTLPASSLPAVSYVKAPLYEDEHPGNSDPVDGQKFVTSEINALMASPDWSSTAVVVTYDDSDGWYDHVYSGAQNGGQPQNASAAFGSSTGDAEAPGVCGGTPITGTALSSGVTVTLGTNDTINYSIGGVAQTPATIPPATYTAATLATAIATATGNKIIAQATAAKKLVLTDNGLSALSITGGDGIASFGLSASSSVAVVPSLTNDTGQPENGRCGFGPRLPFLVVSPYAKTNFVDHSLIDQASVVNFIEYNWGVGTIPGSAAQLLTNPSTTFDMKNLFDFSSGASDVAGATPFILNTSTFQPANPTISWPTPAAVTYGTPLSATQLDASAANGGSSVSGTFTYSPALGSVLPTGTQTLKVSFTPNDTSSLNSASSSLNPATMSTTIQVGAAPLVVTASSPTFVRGQAVPPITAAYSGFVNGDTSASLKTLATCTTSTVSSSSQGQYLTTCSGAASPNYTVTYVSGLVSVVGSQFGLPASTDRTSGNHVLVGLRCTAFETTCSGSITLSVKERKGKRSVAVVLAKGNVSLAAGKSKTVSLKMTSAGKSLLIGRTKPLKVTETSTTKSTKTTKTVKVV